MGVERFCCQVFMTKGGAIPRPHILYVNRFERDHKIRIMYIT